MKTRKIDLQYKKKKKKKDETTVMAAYGHLPLQKNYMHVYRK